MSDAARLPRKNEIIEVHISDLAFGGVGLARIPTGQGDFVIFVQNTIPGQKVRARVTTAKKTFAECRLEEVLESSPDETAIPYQAIPGAPYITLPIEKQHELKRNSCLELYKRIGGIADIESLQDEWISSPLPYHYRNKMEYSFSAIRYDHATNQSVDEFALGFKHRGSWWMVENMDKDSGMFDAAFENGLPLIREWCISTGLTAWHPPGKHGFFRFLVVRKSFHENKLLINLVTSGESLNQFDIRGLTHLLKVLLGDRLGGFIHTINNDIGDRVLPLNGSSRLVFGKPKLVEMMNGLEFEISMESFFQPNPKCAEKLYSKVIDYVGENVEPGKFVFDLFCGTGTIAQLLARGTKQKVVGVDIEASAIEDAKKNARRNHISNVEFHASDVGKFLNHFPHYKDKISTIVLDPPRAGISPAALDKVLGLGASRIVYVSCNPSTQARDAKILTEKGYHLRKISFADQFPHTSHLEAVALFERHS